MDIFGGWYRDNQPDFDVIGTKTQNLRIIPGRT